MNLKLNKVISYLIYSDLIFYTGWGLISPIFALFLVDSLRMTVFVVGMSAAVNLIIRSILRIPFGITADKSQRKSFHFMFWGLLIAALVPLGYIFSTNQWHIYILQAVLGASLAMSTAGWTSIFARHMDKGKESTEFGVDAVAVGIGPGIAGALGGLAVTWFSFTWVFVAVSVLGVVGVLLLLFIRRSVVHNPSIKSGKLFSEREVRRLKKARVS